LDPDRAGDAFIMKMLETVSISKLNYYSTGEEDVGV